jgi:hypothetical protein
MTTMMIAVVVIICSLQSTTTAWITGNSATTTTTTTTRRRTRTVSPFKEENIVIQYHSSDRTSRAMFAVTDDANNKNDDAVTTATAIVPVDPWTMEDLEDYTEQIGVVLTWSTLGPGYRVVARAAYNESMILGYVEGFIRPSGRILHLDKMEIFQPMINKVRDQAPPSSSSSSPLSFGGVSFGLGMVMGYRCLLHGREKGCSVAEFLAIDDEEFQHKRLVRYYQQAGFRVIKYVGDDFRDIPDRMVWGGCGTLMREDMNVLLPKWTRLLQIMKGRAARRQTKE